MHFSTLSLFCLTSLILQDVAYCQQGIKDKLTFKCTGLDEGKCDTSKFCEMKGEVCVKKAKEMKKKCTDMEANMCDKSTFCEMKGEECVMKAKEMKKTCTDLDTAEECQTKSKSCEMKDGLCVKKAKKEKKEKEVY